MSILIKGMEMPVFEHQSWDIRKGADGKWYMVDTNAETSDGEWHEIVPIPPHGDLIEREAAYDKIAEQEGGNYVDMDAVDMGLNETPVIIPAEEEE